MTLHILLITIAAIGIAAVGTPGILLVRRRVLDRIDIANELAACRAQRDRAERDYEIAAANVEALTLHLADLVRLNPDMTTVPTIDEPTEAIEFSEQAGYDPAYLMLRIKTAAIAGLTELPKMLPAAPEPLMPTVIGNRVARKHGWNSPTGALELVGV